MDHIDVPLVARSFYAEMTAVPSVGRKVKVLHVLHAFTHGGLENGVINIINASPSHIEHELCLLTRAGEFIARLHRRIRYYELHKQPGNSLGIIFKLRRVICESGADIVHTRNWAGFDGVLAACLCPGVILMHGEHGRDMKDPKGMKWRRNVARRLFSFRVRYFTTVSHDLRRWLIDIVHVPAQKVVLIPNGVDTERFSPHRDPGLRQELGISEEDFVIGTVGRLDPVKNHAGLLHAVSRLRRQSGKIRLVIVGDGPERQNLENLVKELQLEHTVLLVGFRTDAERFYGIFDTFVLNSFAEGMSNTLLEAMSSGLPVICTPVGAAAEMVTDGERGRVVAMEDAQGLAAAIASYLNDTALRKSHGRAARCLVQDRYSLLSMVRQYAELYLRISAAHSSQRSTTCFLSR